MALLNVLIVDDEPAIRQVLSAAITKAGHSAETAASATEALAKLAKGSFDVVVSDIFMPVTDGIELLKLARAQGIDATFIMVTAFSSVDSAIEAIRAGAHDYISKPVRNEEILLRLDQIAALRGLRDENRALRNLVMGGAARRYTFTSPSMREVERLVSRVAPTASTVLIVGESGTGKGVIASQIHEQSPRAGGPFIPVNCSAIPESLLESEFFGHTKGAFTNADRARKGLFVQASGGTLFLDEIGELPLSMQTKLLHVIEAKQVRPVGADQTQKVDVRIVAATNRDLTKMVADGRFREDLYFRLSVFQIRMPPLRERRADILGLIRYVLDQQGKTGARLELDSDAEELLVNYDWPGNVRQLENVMHRAAILAEDNRIEIGDLPDEVTRAAPVRREAEVVVTTTGTLRERVRAYEHRLIQQAIDEASGDRRLAAQRLGIGLSSLYRKLDEAQSESTH